MKKEPLEHRRTPPRTQNWTILGPKKSSNHALRPQNAFYTHNSSFNLRRLSNLSRRLSNLSRRSSNLSRNSSNLSSRSSNLSRKKLRFLRKSALNTIYTAKIAFLSTF